jgi:hypothetical protein
MASYAAAGIGIVADTLNLPTGDVTAPDPTKCEYFNTVVARRNTETGIWVVTTRGCMGDEGVPTTRDLVLEQAATGAIRAVVDTSQQGPVYPYEGETFAEQSANQFLAAQIIYCADAIVWANKLTVEPLARSIQDAMILRLAKFPDDTEITIHVADHIEELVRIDKDNRPGMPLAKYFNDLPRFCTAAK